MNDLQKYFTSQNLPSDILNLFQYMLMEIENKTLTVGNLGDYLAMDWKNNPEWQQEISEKDYWKAAKSFFGYV